MRQFKRGINDFIVSRKRQVEQGADQLKGLDPDSVQAQRFREMIRNNEIMIKDLENNFTLTLPTLTFNDRLTLDLGDITLKLVHFGEGRHSGDDIIIHCPEEKLLFTGDLFFKGSMQIAFRAQFDAPRWIAVLNDLLKDMSQIEYAFDTHNGRMPGSFVALWRDYLVDIWEGLNSAKDESLSFEDVQNRFAYDKKFTYLEKSGIGSEQLRRDHAESLKFVWRSVMDIRSAADSMRRLITESGIEKALKDYQGMWANRDKKFYFDEVEWNRLGYQLIAENRIEEAIEVFKKNVDMFPESWNVYDSLAEGYMNNGQMEFAVQYYKKSLEINPQNTNAVEMLRRLEKTKQ